MHNLLPIKEIEQKIYFIRGEKVLLDRDLASLYGVKTKYLNKQVNRNIERFPSDFAFQLTYQEVTNLKFQFGTSSLQLVENKDKNWGGRRTRPYAFTEHGVAMLSSVLKSKRAIRVNMAIIRIFIKLRHILASHDQIIKKLIQLENKSSVHDKQIKAIFEAIYKLIEPPQKPKRPIGFNR